MLKSLLKNTWTGIVNVGWVAALVVFISKADLHAPATPARGAELPRQTQAAPKQVAAEPAREEPETPAAPDPPVKTEWQKGLSDLMADIQAEADRKKAEIAEMQRLKDEVAAEATDFEPPPVVWQPVMYATAAPNLHEEHEVGEPYPYSLARLQNNELRWTINEFRWRLGDRMTIGQKFWDLSDIDGPALDGPLPRRLEDLQGQNWELSFRASRLADMMEGKLPQEDWKTPPMPKSLSQVPIPRPSCNGAFCRVPQR